MGKRARDFRADTRRDDRYCEGRARPEDGDAVWFCWNKARSRSVAKWGRQKGQLMFRDELAYLNWYHFNKRNAIRKGKEREGSHERRYE